MKTERNFIYFLRNLNVKHRLNIRNQHDNTEVWYMHISPLSVLAAFIALVLVLFVIILTTVAYTPILDLIPGYPGNKSRDMLIENITKLDSMELVLKDMQIYNDNLALIMDGKTPIVRSHSAGDSVKIQKTELIKPSKEDSLLRAQMEGKGIYSLAGSSQNKSAITLTAPVKGVVSQKFDPKNNSYGVKIAAAAGQQVMAVTEGTVTLAVWSPDDGYVVQIQHANNMVSIYKHNANILCSVGSRIKAGEVIGYTGDAVSPQSGKGSFELQLWQNGTPINPESYIVF